MSNSRRSFVKQILASSTLFGLVPTKEALAQNPPEAKASPKRATDRVIFSASEALVTTSSGKIRGFIRDDVYTFKGIPYGASTAGKNRFMAPRKPESWTGVKDTIAYGFACLQVPGNDWDNPLDHFVMNRDNGVMSEDCLKLNVWTQRLGNSKRRPVMVWIHGGAFQNGSSFQLRWYDGENLCKRGDVVIVSVNHRLNALGFLNLSTIGGEKYASSANVGMLDLVAALEWVRDNIESFGGDSNNVTVFGQSGGGAKVNILMAMPTAKGLFHKAIVQSCLEMIGKPQQTAEVGEQIVRQLGLGSGELDQLQALPYELLMAAARAAFATLSANKRKDNPVGQDGFWWMPTADGKIVAGAPYIDGGEDLAKHIPLVVGCTLHEASPSQYDESLEQLTEAELRERVLKTYGAKTDAILVAYKAEYPGVRPIEIYSMLESLRYGGPALAQAEAKAAQGGAPAFAYRFEWSSDICDGRMRAFHGLDMAFSLDNTQRAESATGGGERAGMLASRMSQAWIQFATTGKPDHRDLPHWPAFNNDNKPVMIFDDVCQVKNRPDSAARALIYGR